MTAAAVRADGRPTWDETANRFFGVIREIRGRAGWGHQPQRARTRRGPDRLRRRRQDAHRSLCEVPVDGRPCGRGFVDRHP